MGYFLENLKMNCLVVRRDILERKGGLPYQTIAGENINLICNFNAPYLDGVREYYASDELMDKRRLILATDDGNMAMKTAVLLAGFNQGLDDDDDQWEWNSYDDYDEYVGEQVIHIDFSSYMENDKMELFCQGMVADANSMGVEDIFFTGGDVINNWGMVYRVLSMCSLPYQYIQVSMDNISHPDVQRLIYERGFKVLKLPSFHKDYYERSVMDKLLFQADYTLGNDCKKDELIRGLKKKRGKHMCEEDVAIFLDMAVEAAAKAGRDGKLMYEDFKSLVPLDTANAWDRLNNLTGLDEIKQVAEELVAVALEQGKNSKLKCGREHMVFYGKPGTGKTTCAKLLSQLLEDEGCGNGSFIVATRKDLIGEYVGHTAPLISKRFEEARGGVLFVDEAGFLLNKNAGGFVTEAIKEFVRYMEQYHDVTVIFAMYPHEAKEFYDLDPGLASRVKRNVEFKDYTNQELREIAISMFKDNGYTVGKGVIAMIDEYIVNTKKADRDTFGNARTMRKLVDMSVKELSIRHYRNKKTKNSANILSMDIRNAMDKLYGVRVEKNPIGFSCPVRNRV